MNTYRRMRLRETAQSLANWGQYEPHLLRNGGRGRPPRPGSAAYLDRLLEPTELARRHESWKQFSGINQTDVLEIDRTRDDLRQWRRHSLQSVRHLRAGVSDNRDLRIRRLADWIAESGAARLQKSNQSLALALLGRAAPAWWALFSTIGVEALRKDIREAKKLVRDRS